MFLNSETKPSYVANSIKRPIITIYKSNKYNGEPSMSIGEICATSKESIASDISHALISMQKIGFEQGRKYVRDALGIIK